MIVERAPSLIPGDLRSGHKQANSGHELSLLTAAGEYVSDGADRFSVKWPFGQVMLNDH